MPQDLIFDNWEDYDRRKSSTGDKTFFNCKEEWEREYLKNKIVAVFPSKSDKQVLAAILLTCKKNERRPVPRTEFIEAVLKNLGVHRLQLHWL